MSRQIVLILTHSGDYFTVDRVAEALSKRGVQPFRLDTDKFPLEVQLAVSLDNYGLTNQLKYGDQSVRQEEVQAVWMRRLWQPQMSKDLAPQFQEACARESIATLNGFLDGLENVYWLDNLARIREAENKLRQLRVATKVGLNIPRTLVTNDPQQARQFFHKLAGKMVAKLLTPISFGMEASSFFVYTSAVKEADLLEAEMLRHSPMVFQEQIPKLRELRVIFVAGSFFTGALDSSRYQAKTIDWRRAQPDDCQWEEHQLPSQVTSSLTALMAKLGLGFGAIDLIEQPNGEYVFLEVNPTGEWGMLERDLAYPISEAIAQALLEKSS